MTADEYLKAIKKHKLKVTPVLGKRGKIDFWQAGKVKVFPGTFLNYVPPIGYAHGRSPEEAVEKLLKGQTERIMSRDGIVTNSKAKFK